MTEFTIVAAGEIGYFKGGSGFPLRFQGQASGELPFFKVSDMNNPGNELFMRTSNNYVSEATRKRMGAARIPAGAIVFAKVGAAVFLERKRILAQDSCIDNNMAAFIVDPARLNNRFAHYLLSDFKLSDLVATTALPSLNGGQLRSVPFRLPTIDQQHGIVEALGSVDELISRDEERIVKKRTVKQGMMQELLTGRTRLGGFAGKWSNRKLSTLGIFLRGRGITRDQVRASGVPCIRYGELYTLYSDYTSSTASFVDPSVAAAALPIRRGDILFAGSGETKEEIGKCVAYVGDAPAVAGGDIIVLRGSDFDPVYLASLLNTPQVANEKARGGQGDAVVHINWRVLAGLELTMPSRPEQEAIGAVLRDADSEIAALEHRLDVCRAIKQGMMQELLTGRTRLVRTGA